MPHALTLDEGCTWESCYVHVMTSFGSDYALSHREWRPLLHDNPDARLREEDGDDPTKSYLENAHTHHLELQMGDGYSNEFIPARDKRARGLPANWRLSVLSHDLDAAIYAARVHPLIELTTEI
jgi:hypothetical protein